MSQRAVYPSPSPPRTPPSQTSKFRSKRAYPARPSIRDTFPDASTQGNAPRASESGDERDPHDLSLSPKHAARTSIVDNMLLSLDQFDGPGSSFLDDYRLFNSAFEPDSQGRYRGHTFSSSMSSDADLAHDDASSSRYATVTAGGRRSNNSSIHQTVPKRMGSARGPESMGSRGGMSSRVNDVRQGSKGSFHSNGDYSYPVHRSRADSDGPYRRSESFDCGPKKAYNQFADHGSAQDSLLYDDDAAPTPSIPAGPRKHYDYKIPSTSTSRTPGTSRRNSIKSSSAAPARRNRTENIGTGSLKLKDHDFFGDPDLDPLSSPPAVLDPPAPSPTISYNKPAYPPSEAINPSTIPALPPTQQSPIVQKERPGFFRRVFGSSSKAFSPAEGPVSTTSDLALRTDGEGRNPSAATGSSRAWGSQQTRPSQQQQPPPPPKSAVATTSTAGARKNPPQVVRQKSSFFRRRKKSVAENVPPPIKLPQELSPNTLDMTGPQASPVSSLRQMMHQYLDEPGASADTDRKGYSHNAENQRVESVPLEAKRPPGIVAASGSSSKPNLKIEPQSSSQGPDSRVSTATGAGASSDSQNASDVESFCSTDSPLQEKNSNANPSNTLSPVAEHPSRTIRVSTTMAPPAAPHQNMAASSGRLFLPGDVTIPQSPAASDVSQYLTASNTPVIESEEPQIVVNGDESNSKEDMTNGPGDALEDGPTAQDREQAQKLFESQEQMVGNVPAAAWLGDPDRALVREAYMRLFNWSNMNILAALRSLCQRLILKGETQQVDRVLDAFSCRWCDCNPSHGFKATDVVHTICYSLLLLNTDLHLADIEQKMTKTQFVRNTMPTIHRVAIDAAPESFETLRPQKARSTPTAESLHSGTGPSRLSNIPADSNHESSSDYSRRSAPEADAGPLVCSPFNGTMRAWEQQVEMVLKDFYTSIQRERLPLFGAPREREVTRMASSNFLAPSAGNLRRSPSTISKSGSDIFPRGRSADSRHGAARWSSKPRSRGARLYPSSMMGSSRTSLDDQSSVWSPAASSTWSKYSLGKFTSVSVDSFGSEYPRGEYQQSIGFANALSQAIIREDSATSVYSYEEPSTPLLEDETLALAGAPWAKEGSVKHKHHLDAVDKRAKDRNWNECFAVIQQGWMRLFSFNNASKTMRQRAKQRGGVVVGGGNWTENAEEIWKFMLRQTIASALPSPGYSKSRPHVWALSLPTGAVHLFQVGTPEIVREFVSTANYWSARLSKQPLVGGISNIEYGWSDAVINSALINGESRSPPTSSGAARQSIQSSIRSSLDHQGVVRPKLPADRVHISDWSPPQQSMVASHQSEEEQLKALQTYVQNVEDDLQRHNELRPAMNLAFSPRHPNATKAMANWERKSSYLLREIVKFRTYIDSLRNAIAKKSEIYSSTNSYFNPDLDGTGADADADTEAQRDSDQPH
ncbi:hypothetical protein N7539_009094 [Penicillium diatomitis]|uniref:SEC7 domain-containing protein n=1 Tax=Penicillium diatomitis TaxID=2819901 RepID=A0A9X0BJD4_9EURO|nr:uncharacterized protein N7539_009094 [Penicillium diatomitis]KAJ5469476.1 hypothetical protein N7539_009094 [Penicillium diatomitis]